MIGISQFSEVRNRSNEIFDGLIGVKKMYIFKKYVLSFVCAAFFFLATLNVSGFILRQYEFNKVFKGFLIISSAVLVGNYVYSWLSNRVKPRKSTNEPVDHVE